MTEKTKKAIKLATLNATVICATVLLFSPGFIGLELDLTDALESALAVLAAMLLGGTFAFGNWFLVSKRKPPTLYRQGENDTLKGCREMLLGLERKCFQADVEKALNQIGRMARKKETLNVILSQHFDPSELSFQKYQSVTEGVEGLFTDNIRAMANRITVFDYEDFRESAKKYKDMAPKQRTEQPEYAVYMEHIAFVETQLRENDEMLSRMDALLLELSELDDGSGNVSELPAMLELESLITNTKYYKRN